MKYSAANLRRLLLGGGSDDDDSVAEDSDNDDTFFKSSSKAKGKKVKEVVEDTADAGFQDDFFMDDGEGLEVEEEEITKAAPIKSKKTSKKGQKGEEGDMTFTYVPDAKQQLLERKTEPEQNLDETPFETMQRRLTEKRKARKAAKKLLKSGGGSVGEEDEDVEEVAVKATGKKGKMAEKEREAATKAELELLLSDDDEGYDMRALHKQELEETKGPKGKRKRYDSTLL